MAESINTLTTPLLSLQDVTCGYHRTDVVHNISFQVQQGEIACLLGPSGCGKSTLLRAIAGFESVRKGQITLLNQVLSSPEITVEPPHRSCTMVFQDLALFPHLNVLDNITFGLRDLARRDAQERAEQYLALVGMANFARRFPHELSGGQQQRIALARALAPQPAIVLLDEPFSSLDTDLRARLAEEVRALLKSNNITAILVTHDQQEAFSMADQVGVLNQGQLIQWDPPYVLYHEPCDRFVANFVGQGCLVPGRQVNAHTVDTALGQITGPRAYTWPAGSAVEVLIRPDDIIYAPQSTLRATVVDKSFRGGETLYTLNIANLTLLSALPSHINLAPGQEIGIELDAQHVVAFAQ